MCVAGAPMAIRDSGPRGRDVSVGRADWSGAVGAGWILRLSELPARASGGAGGWGRSRGASRGAPRGAVTGAVCGGVPGSFGGIMRGGDCESGILRRQWAGRPAWLLWGQGGEAGARDPGFGVFEGRRRAPPQKLGPGSPPAWGGGEGFDLASLDGSAAYSGGRSGSLPSRATSR